MRAAIVFDSMFDNTHAVAEAVAEGLMPYAQVELFTVDDAPDRLDAGIDLLIVGGPTHGHGMSSQTSRKVTAKQRGQGAVPSRIGLREWLATLTVPRAVLVATFDTRFDKPRWLTGSAAQRAAKLLRRHGHIMLVPPESFYVDTSTGPLRDGEPERAQRWGDLLGAMVAATDRALPRP